MYIVAAITIGFIAAGIFFTWLMFYLMSSSKRQLVSRTALLTEQITQAGVTQAEGPLNPESWIGEWCGRVYQFIFATEEKPTLRMEITVKNRLHGQLCIHPKKRMGRFPMLAMGVEEKRVLAGDPAFDQAFITTSVPTSFGEMVVRSNPLLREQLLQNRRTTICLEENTLSLFPNLADEQDLSAERWQQYMTLLETLAAAIEG